jgi:hypothetical protein
MIRDNSPCRLQWNTHEASVSHALGFSESRTRLQWSFIGGFSGVGGGGVLEPSAPSNFLKKSWEILEPVAKSRESSAGNSGYFASSDGIVRWCTNHDLRRGGISVTWLGDHSGYRTWVPDLGTGARPGYQITDGIAPLIHSAVSRVDPGNLGQHKAERPHPTAQVVTLLFASGPPPKAAGSSGPPIDAAQEFLLVLSPPKDCSLSQQG